MSVQKYIYWFPESKNGDNCLANVHLLSDSGDGNLETCNELVTELRKTFPEASDRKIRVGRIYRSSTVYGFTIVAWSEHLPKAEYPGWIQKETKIEYTW